MVLPMVGPVASLIACSSHLDVVWVFVTWPGVGVSHIFVGLAREKAVLGDVVHF
jgi:hypothetical protein